MTLGWYNGWSPAERLAVIPAQREAVRTGTLPRPTRCSICDTSHEHGGSNPVWLHDENYAEPLAAYPICRRCHHVLHESFDAPEPWLALVARYGAGSGSHWYERLTLDAQSLHQPFGLTYPDGLPRPAYHDPSDGRSPP